ncbi:MAG: DNA-directed RNA polymerase subunit omega [Nitrospirae bacterium]|nr:MAG: DNA-directed RNA polymerase subunit omega [Nitrospirota bacterium]
MPHGHAGLIRIGDDAVAKGGELLMDALSLLPDDLTRVGSRSRLVIVSAQRARQFMQGIPSSIVTKHTKPTTIALEQVLKGHVKFLVGKDARQAMKEAKKQRERELERLAVARVAGEDASEIKKDLSVMVDDSKPVEPGEED